LKQGTGIFAKPLVAVVLAPDFYFI